ncbi:MAG: alpha-galactosidase [bacterium]|nr:alpha-galactosidase [bacterium]
MKLFFNFSVRFLIVIFLSIPLIPSNVYPTIKINSDGSFNIQVGKIALQNCLPAINDKLVDGSKLQIINNDLNKISLSYADPLGTLVLVFNISQDDILLKTTIQKCEHPERLENFSPIFAQQVKGSATFLRQGFTSWDGSSYVKFREVKKTQTSYGVTALHQVGGGVLLGFDRFDRMINRFIFEKKGKKTIFKIVCDWDNKKIDPNQNIESEELLLRPYQNLEDALQTWARSIALKQNARIRKEPTIGWCSWYYAYSFISQEVFDEYIPSFKPYWSKMKMEYFLIDDGYQYDCGDWLIPNCKFPQGIDYTLNQIRETGYKPGIWIAPFVVGNFSQLFKNHPDWILRDEQGKPIIKMSFYNEWHWGSRRDTEYYVLDTSHPDAFDYLRTVFHTLKHEWNIDYVKTDFMYWGTSKGKRYTPGKTPVEYFMDVVRMIREEIGEDTFWSGCGMPLLPSIGYVDGMRISGDMGPQWGNGIKRIVRDMQARNYFQGIFWQNDPDCILLRDFANDYKLDQKVGLARLMGMGGGMMLTSDPLHELTDENRNLFNFILPENGTMRCSYPFLEKNNDVVVQVREIQGQTNRYVVHLFNITDKIQKADYSLKDLNIPEKLYACFYDDKRMTEEAVDHIRIKLNPFSTHLIFLQQTPIRQLPAGLNF